MKMTEKQARLFINEEGKLAMRGLKAYGVKTLEGFKLWQLRFYVEQLYPWPECLKIWAQYEDWCKTHKWMLFRDWYYFNIYSADDEKTDYSCYDDPELGYTDFSRGDPIDKIEDIDEYIEIDC